MRRATFLLVLALLTAGILPSQPTAIAGVTIQETPEASSAPFTMAAKSSQPYILMLGTTTHPIWASW